MRTRGPCRSLLVGLAFVVVAIPASCGAGEPRATFAFKAGWVELVLKQDGKPAVDAIIHIIDEGGLKFGEGQTDENGEAAFPVPKGSSFIVEIKTGSRTADPIRLFKTEQGIEPARVLLGYGLRPCCRGKPETEATPALAPVESPSAPEQSPSTWFLVGGVLAAFFLAAMMVFVRRQRANGSDSFAREDTEPFAPGIVSRVNRETLPIWAPLIVIGLLAGGLAAFYVYRHTSASGNVPVPKRDLAREAREDLERRSFRPLSTSLESLLADPSYDPIPTQSHDLLLMPAPEFTLLDMAGKEWSLAHKLKEGPVALVFYYGYHCDHCVSQLFALDKDVEKFRELGVSVVAISADPVELTRARVKQYGAFGFPVLSDPGNQTAEKYQTFVRNPKSGEEGDQIHGTFVITRTGKVIWVNLGDAPFTENRTLLQEIARAEGRLPGAP